MRERLAFPLWKRILKLEAANKALSRGCLRISASFVSNHNQNVRDAFYGASTLRPSEGAFMNNGRPSIRQPKSDNLDKTVARIAKEAAHAKLPAIYQVVSKVKEIKRIAEVAESAGDQETADAVRLALRGLAAEAIV